MEQTKPFFSPEMCQKLSSFAPGFEGHWAYVESSIDGKTQVVCAFKRYSWRWANDYKFICPAWQVEDVLWNMEKIFPKLVYSPQIYVVAREIVTPILDNTPDTAYQKIEEYLWSILK